MGLDMYLSCTKQVDIMYWRKCDPINAYFLSISRTCPDEPIFPGQQIHINRQEIQNLVSILKQVVEKNDVEFTDEVLPLVSFNGFSTKKYYNEFWANEFKDSILVLERELKNNLLANEFIYSFSC